MTHVFGMLAAIALTAICWGVYGPVLHFGRDAMQSALPFLKETNSDLDDAAAILEQDRIAMEGYAGAVDGLTGSLKDISIPHRNYLEMMAEAATNLGNNTELAKQYTDQLGKVRQAQAASGFSPPSFAGGQVGTGVAGTSSSATASGVSNAVACKLIREMLLLKK